MNPLQFYNYVPTTVNGNQFVGFRQSADYMTDYRNSSDLYSYFVNNASSTGVTTGHQLRQYLQDNGTKLASDLFNTTAKQFIGMEVQGSQILVVVLNKVLFTVVVNNLLIQVVLLNNLMLNVVYQVKNV